MLTGRQAGRQTSGATAHSARHNTRTRQDQVLCRRGSGRWLYLDCLRTPEVVHCVHQGGRMRLHCDSVVRQHRLRVPVIRYCKQLRIKGRWGG